LTIRRELRRNALPRGGDLPVHAEGCHLERRQRQATLERDAKLGRFVLAARLAGKSAAGTVAVMRAVFRRLGPRLRSSITFDNDTAFARHGRLASVGFRATWFCDARAFWPKRAVENANGRLRCDLPRDLDRDARSDVQLQEIMRTHNLTPRQGLSCLTPRQAQLGELGQDGRIRFA
jgi:IS30 family transposase